MAETFAAACLSDTSATSDAVVETLVKRGWSFADLEHAKAIIAVKCVLIDDIDDTRSVADVVESELLNSDLRSIGAKSLPEPAVLRKSSHLLGPKVLQVKLDFLLSPSSVISDRFPSDR